MSKEQMNEMKELLDHIGDEVNLLYKAKLKREVLQVFIDLLEDKQDMLNFFDEYSKKSVEIEQQNKRYREFVKTTSDPWEIARKIVAGTNKNGASAKEIIDWIERESESMLEEYK